MHNANELIREADRQTQAIMLLEVWKRLAYSLLAIGALLIYMRVWQGGALWTMVVGVIFAIVGAAASLVLVVGITRAKNNVRQMLRAAGVDPDAVMTHKKTKERPHE